MRGLTPSCGTDCSAAPRLALLYITTNLAYNVSVLTLLRTAGSRPNFVSPSGLVH